MIRRIIRSADRVSLSSQSLISRFAHTTASEKFQRDVKLITPPKRAREPKPADSILEPTHRIPLTQEFPGTPKSLYDPSKAHSYATKITTLPNGVRVASEDSPSSAAAMAVFIDAGSIYESDATHGISRMMERMAFKATNTRSSKDVVQALEDLGGNVLAASSREAMVLSAETVRPLLPTALDVISDGLKNPLYEEAELDAQKEVMMHEIEEIDERLDSALTEVLHTVAFEGQPLGRAMLVDRERLAAITVNDLRAFHDQFYRPERVIVAIAGMAHDEAVALAKEKLGDMVAPNTPSPAQRPTSRYTGGSRLIEMSPDYKLKHPDDVPVSHIILAWEGCPAASDELYAIATLHSLLGGGGSFSSGGPGKGMYSRLYRHVLSGNDYIENVSAFNQAYHDTGLFGVYLTVRHGKMLKALQDLCGELLTVAYEINDEEFARAKNQLKSSIFMSLEARGIHADDIGRQVLMYNKRLSAREICDRIDSLTIADVQKCFKRIVHGEPTFLVYGKDIQKANLPDTEAIKTFFKENTVDA